MCSLRSGRDPLTLGPHLPKDTGALNTKQRKLLFFLLSLSSKSHQQQVPVHHAPHVKDTRRCFLVPGKQGSPKVKVSARTVQFALPWHLRDTFLKAEGDKHSGINLIVLLVGLHPKRNYILHWLNFQTHVNARTRLLGTRWTSMQQMSKNSWVDRKDGLVFTGQPQTFVLTHQACEMMLWGSSSKHTHTHKHTHTRVHY